MKTRSFLVGTGAIAFLALGLVAGCPTGDSQLADQVADLETQLAALADQLQQSQQQPGIDGQDGADGAPGEDGLSCWDLNGNRQGDPAEDINGDGNFDADDCRGADGQDGEPGDDGDPGADGMSCWDTNGNGIAEASEDLNNDGQFNALDCQGADGEDLTGVIARAQVDADGTNVSGGAEITASRIGTGRYQILVTLPEELDNGALDHFDFPVVVTPWAVEITPGVEAMFAVSTTALNYADTDGNGVRDQLTLNVTVMKIFPGDVEAWDDGFSIVVLEP